MKENSTTNVGFRNITPHCFPDARQVCRFEAKIFDGTDTLYTGVAGHTARMRMEFVAVPRPRGDVNTRARHFIDSTHTCQPSHISRDCPAKISGVPLSRSRVLLSRVRPTLRVTACAGSLSKSARRYKKKCGKYSCKIPVFFTCAGRI